MSIVQTSQRVWELWMHPGNTIKERKGKGVERYTIHTILLLKIFSMYKIKKKYYHLSSSVQFQSLIAIIN